MRNAFLGTVVAIGMIAAGGQPALAQQDPYASCTQPTVDTISGKADGIAARYWLKRLQGYVKDDDRKAVADNVNFPLEWNTKTGIVLIKSRGEFLKKYDDLFTPELKGKIAKQDLKCLPADDEGAKVADGELRFSLFSSENQFRVTSISQPGIKKNEKLPWE